MVNNESNIILASEMHEKQIKSIDLSYKLTDKDINRICKYIDSSIFTVGKCVIWKGYITHRNNIKRNPVINFFYHGTKISLHRLLYINFIGNLERNNYIRLTCANKGFCCNINCMHKYDYKHLSEKKTVQKSTTNVNNLDIKF
jgi:hypothetical protein